jgi:hypothetical protein
MDWLESAVFCAVDADACARNNGYNSERCFLHGSVQQIMLYLQ